MQAGHQVASSQLPLVLVRNQPDSHLGRPKWASPHWDRSIVFISLSAALLARCISSS